MAETDLINLYSGRILALAADIPNTGRLEQPQATVTKRSPVCGSNVTVDVVVENGRIVEFAQDVRACALGQAAAAVVGANVIGLGLDEVRAGRDALVAMLKGDGEEPGAPFGDFGVLKAAKGFEHRHRSILLAIEATAEAMEKAQRAACA